MITRSRIGAVALAALLGTLSLAGCAATNLEWHGSHVSLRSYGLADRLSFPAPTERAVLGIERDQHYLSLLLESLYLRNLPGAETGAVVLGIELRGAGPRPIKTVIEVLEPKHLSGLVFAQQVLILQPFVYRGGALDLTVHLQPIRRDQVGNVRGRLYGAGDALRRLSIHAGPAISMAANIFEGVLGVFERSRPPRWKRTFRFQASGTDAIGHGEPLTAGRHVLVFRPPAELLPSFEPSMLVRSLALRGSRLYWRDDGAEFIELPYLVVHLGRFHRYPHDWTPYQSAAREVTRALEQWNLDMAEAARRNARGHLADDRVLTRPEKTLEALRLEHVGHRIETLRAVRDGRHDDARASRVDELNALARILETSADILLDSDLRELVHQRGKIIEEHDRATRRAPPTSTAFDEALRRLEAARAKVAATRKGADDRLAAFNARYGGPPPTGAPVVGRTTWVE